LVFLFILIIFVLITIIFVYSKISIEIINFKFNSETIRHINKDYEIIIKLKILGFISILKVSITKAKIENLKLQEKIKNIDINIFENGNKIDKKFLTAFKKLNIDIKEIELQITLGTENAFLTSILVPAISTIIAFVLHKKIKEFNKQKFIIEPIYMNQNLVNLDISGIFEVKIRHIINMISNLSKNEKKGVKEYERTSNRRAYGYSYE